MNKIWALILAIASILILSAAGCTTAASPVTTPAPAAESPSTPATQPPVIKGIAGALEWAPSSKGPLTCLAVDLEGYPLTFSWASENGTIEGQGQTVTWTAPGIPGNYTVTVTVTDAVGAQSTQSRDIKVTSNPLRNEVKDETIYLNFPLPSNGPVTASKQVLIETVSDIQCLFPNADPKQIKIAWSAPVGKLFGDGIADGTASRVGWLAPGVPGQYTVNVQISDNLGRTSTGSVSFDVIPIEQ